MADSVIRGRTNANGGADFAFGQQAFDAREFVFAGRAARGTIPGCRCRRCAHPVPQPVCQQTPVVVLRPCLESLDHLLPGACVPWAEPASRDQLWQKQKPLQRAVAGDVVVAVDGGEDLPEGVAERLRPALLHPPASQFLEERHGVQGAVPHGDLVDVFPSVAVALAPCCCCRCWHLHWGVLDFRSAFHVLEPFGSLARVVLWRRSP